jgi:hypothetical protein
LANVVANAYALFKTFSSCWKELKILNKEFLDGSMDGFVMEMQPAEGEELAQALNRNASAR